MSADRSKHPIVHFVGSIPLPNAETVFSTLSAATGTFLIRLPDGETGIRKSFTQWDGKLLREIPRLRIKPGAKPDPNEFKTGYADMAINPGPFSTECKSRARSQPA